ncbi:putative ring-cleaving dioxygenase MhqA [compost metagenome]
MRTPGGALFEASVSKPEGFLVDEAFEDLGKTIQIPPQLGARAQEIAAYLEPLKY